MTPEPRVEGDGERVVRVIREAWLRYRLAPKLFGLGGRLYTGDSDVQATFGFAEEVPAELLSRKSNDRLWRDLGHDFARGEVRELLDRLAAACEVKPTTSLRREVSRILNDMRPIRGEAAIVASGGKGLVAELELPAKGPVEEERSLGSPWYRGTFEEVPVFSVPLVPTRPLWVVDFGRLGEWRARLDADALDLSIELVRDRLVPYGGTPVPGVVIRAVEYVELSILDAQAARGLSA